jgi:hypothetical protein
MTGEYQADLKNIAQKLKVIHDELLHLELATGAPCLQQAALSAAKALAWCDLVDMISNLTRSTSQASISFSENATL